MAKKNDRKAAVAVRELKRPWLVPLLACIYFIVTCMMFHGGNKLITLLLILSSIVCVVVRNGVRSDSAAVAEDAPRPGKILVHLDAVKFAKGSFQPFRRVEKGLGLYPVRLVHHFVPQLNGPIAAIPAGSPPVAPVDVRLDLPQLRFSDIHAQGLPARVSAIR